MLHVVFSHAVEQVLKQALMMKATSLNGEIHLYELELQFGHLENEDDRHKMWSDVYQLDANEDRIKQFNESANKQRSRVFKAIDNCDKIRFWVGETEADELAFLCLLSSLNFPSKRLEFNRFRGNLTLGSILPERIEKNFQPTLITEDLKLYYQKKWEEVCNNGDKIRVRVEDFTFCFIDYHFYDQQLLQLISKKDEIKMVVAVGEMHIREPQLPYYFFVWRVKQLTKEGFIGISGEKYGFRHTYLKKV